MSVNTKEITAYYAAQAKARNALRELSDKIFG